MCAQKYCLLEVYKINDITNKQTTPLAGLVPSGPRKKYSPIHCIQQLLEQDVQDPPPPIEDCRKPPWEEQWVDVDGAKWLRQYADKQILLLKKAEERWQEQYNNDPKGAWFRQMEPKMVRSTSVTKLRLKWTLRDALRRILSKIVQYRSGHGLVGVWRERISRGEDTEEFNCPCGAQTIQYIFKECVLSETRRHFLREVSPTLEERVLLGTARGIKAMEKLLA
jgi:hypothetical protein